MAPNTEVVTMTISSDEGEPGSDEVTFLGSARRLAGSNASTLGRKKRSGATEDRRSRPDPSSAPSKRRSGSGPIDIRSDASSETSAKPSNDKDAKVRRPPGTSAISSRQAPSLGANIKDAQREATTSSRSPGLASRKQTFSEKVSRPWDQEIQRKKTARKPAPSTTVDGYHQDNISMSDDELPDFSSASFSQSPISSRRPASGGQTPGEPTDPMVTRKKRRRDDSNSSPVGGQVLKKKKINGSEVDASPAISPHASSSRPLSSTQKSATVSSSKFATSSDHQNGRPRGIDGEKSRMQAPTKQKESSVITTSTKLMGPSSDLRDSQPGPIAKENRDRQRLEKASPGMVRQKSPVKARTGRTEQRKLSEPRSSPSLIHKTPDRSKNSVARGGSGEGDIRGSTVPESGNPKKRKRHPENSDEKLGSEPADVSHDTMQQINSPPRTTAARLRIDSSEDDQGYASLSSGRGDGIGEFVKPGQNPPEKLQSLEEHKKSLQQSLSVASPKASNRELEDREVHTDGSKAAMSGGKDAPVAEAIVASISTLISDAQGQTASQRGGGASMVSAQDQTQNIGNAVQGAAGGKCDPSETSATIGETSRSQSRATLAIRNPAEAGDQLQSEAVKSLGQNGLLETIRTEFAVPQSAGSTLNATSTFEKLSLGNKVEKVLGQYLTELAEDNEYWSYSWMRRARLRKEKVQQPSLLETERPTSFASFQPKTAAPKPYDKSKKQFGYGFERMASGKPIESDNFVATIQQYSTDDPDVPSYSHYVSIRDNILAPNVKSLHCWPYFGDEFDTNNNAGNLREQYHLDIDKREQKLLRLRQAQKHEEYVEGALADLGCSWADVLTFLLDPAPVVGDNPDALKALKKRADYCQEDFDRETKRWLLVLSVLPNSTPEKLACAAVLCETFQKLTGFSLWHVARRSPLCKLPNKSPVQGQISAGSDDFTCRICMRFNCPYHGELEERPDDYDDESDSSSSSIVAKDLVHPPKINYRTRVAFPPTRQTLEEPEKPTGRPEKKDLRYWQRFETRLDARGPFYPCYHPGQSCDDKDADCSCHADKIPCEKSCACSQSCNRKFQGCSCSVQKVRPGKRGPCFEDERCLCWQLGRECDPDLCGTCGVCEVVDPVNKYDEDITHGRCQNASIQRGVPKCTILGDSGVHGLGLYACENIRPNEFVGEYKGEIITKEEAERRGAVYEHQKLSYLFSLNARQEIDSTYFGNKVRFINHATGNRATLYPRIIMVNTVHRIGMYANSFIKPGQELFFDYGPMFPDEQLGGKKSKKSAPHVRNANLVKGFHDVEEREDELGNVRLEAVTSTPRQKGKGKLRGGARTGAGRKPRQHGEEPRIALPTATDKGQREVSPFIEEELVEQDAGQRLTAYNISDGPSDPMEVDFDPGAGADDDDDYDEDAVEDDSEASEDGDSEDDGDAEADGIIKRRRGRPSLAKKSASGG